MLVLNQIVLLRAARDIGIYTDQDPFPIPG